MVRDEGHLLVDRAIHGDELVLCLCLTRAVTDDARVGRSDNVRGALDHRPRELLHEGTVGGGKGHARLGLDDRARGVAVEEGICHDGRELDAREGIRGSLLPEEIGECRAVEHPEVASRYHFFEPLCTGLLGTGVDGIIVFREGEAVEAARLHVDDHGLLAAVREVLEVAGVLPRGVDRADVGVLAFVRRREEHGNRVVDDGDGHDVLHAAPHESILEEIVYDLALDPLRRELLRPCDEPCVAEIRLLRGEGEGVAEQILGLMVALDCLVDDLGEEVEHLIRRCIRADVVVDAGEGERLGNLAFDLILAAAVEAEAEGADVRPAEVKCEECAGLSARRQTRERAEHPQARAFFVRKPCVHLGAKIIGNVVQRIVVQGKGCLDFLKFLMIQFHDFLPPRISKNDRASHRRSGIRRAPVPESRGAP